MPIKILQVPRNNTLVQDATGNATSSSVQNTTSNALLFKVQLGGRRLYRANWSLAVDNGLVQLQVPKDIVFWQKVRGVRCWDVFRQETVKGSLLRV